MLPDGILALVFYMNKIILCQRRGLWYKHKRVWIKRGSMAGNAITYANLSNLAFVEQVYQNYKQDPTSVDSSWQYFLRGWSLQAAFQVDDEGSDAAEDLQGLPPCAGIP
jgi:hypothetical protein